MLVGLVGVVVPLLPGTALVLAAGIGWAVLVVEEGTTRWVVVGVMAALLLAGTGPEVRPAGPPPGRPAPPSHPAARRRRRGGRARRPPAAGAARRRRRRGLRRRGGAVAGPGAGLAQHRAGAAGRRDRRAGRADRRRAHGRHLARRPRRHLSRPPEPESPAPGRCCRKHESRDLVRRRLPVVLRRQAPLRAGAGRLPPPRPGRGGVALVRARRLGAGRAGGRLRRSCSPRSTASRASAARRWSTP